MFKGLTTVTQGTIGVSAAIYEYTKMGWCVSIPINDNQPYDLIVDRGDGPKRVQIKTTGFLRSNRYQVQLKSVRPNKTENIIRNFDHSAVEELFILCENGDCYSIPTTEFKAVSALSLNEDYDKWKVAGKVPKQT